MNFPFSSGMTVCEFLRKTCLLYERPHINRFIAVLCRVAHTIPMPDGSRMIGTITGSVSELYIDPMLPCVNDFDVMFYPNNWLVIPKGLRAPLDLPAEFHDKVEVYEMDDIESYPGFVSLPHIGTLIKRDGSGKYAFHKSRPRAGNTRYARPDMNLFFLWKTTHANSELHGPAVSQTEEVGLPLGPTKPQDSVFCIRCLSWPPQADEWRTRNRQRGWPDSAIIDRIVRGGCDVVQVPHWMCKTDEWKAKHQWRLSFSRAETILLNSWTPTQQIVYHILRFYLKNAELFKHFTFIKTYHMKTLMLWASEILHSQFWELDCFVIICTQLLHYLAAALKSRVLPMYFVTQCNLFDGLPNVNTTVVKLNDIAVDNMSQWLFVNYMYEWTGVQNLSLLMAVNMIEQNVLLSKVLDARSRSLSNLRLDYVQGILACCQDAVRDLIKSTDMCNLKVYFEELPSVDARLLDFLLAVALLRAAGDCDIGLRNRTTIGIIRTVIDKCHGDCEHIAGFLSANQLESCKAWFQSAAKQMDDLAGRTMDDKSFKCHLTKLALERLTTARNMMSEEYGSLAPMVSTDYRALYFFKVGSMEKCMKLSFWNALELNEIYSQFGETDDETEDSSLESSQDHLTMIQCMPHIRVSAIPSDILLLFDDDSVCVLGLSVMCGIIESEYKDSKPATITQLPLSLYLLIKCQVELLSQHPLASVPALVKALRWIQRVHRCHHPIWKADRLLLMFVYRKTIIKLRERYTSRIRMRLQ